MSPRPHHPRRRRLQRRRRSGPLSWFTLQEMALVGLLAAVLVAGAVIKSWRERHEGASNPSPLLQRAVPEAD